MSQPARIRIVYLYAEVMGYTMATIRTLSRVYNAEIHVIHWDKKKLTPYQNESIDHVFFYSRSNYSVEKLRDLVRDISPQMVVMSGWMDRGYLSIAKMLKNRIPIIICFDNQWRGSLKQYVVSVYFSFLKKQNLYAWVPGIYQFEFARKLGFDKKNIKFDLYSADSNLFDQAYHEYSAAKQKKYPHKFLFVGRLEEIKGINTLIEAWQDIQHRRKDWALQLVGTGALKEKIQGHKSITVLDFMQPDVLKNEIATSGCFILPSVDEPWGVVIHEFSAAGLPLLCSETCGAAQQFLIEGLNGFSFKPNNKDSLIRKMLHIISLSDSQLLEMSKHSNDMAKRISPLSSAANLMSVME